MKLLKSLAIAFATLAATASTSLAQDFPNRIVRIVVPQAAGGTTDVLARLIADKLGQEWKQNVIVENKVGAGGALGNVAVANAAPDGYTLVVGTTGSHAVASSLKKNLGYHPIDSFSPIGMVATTPNILIVHPSLEVRTVADLVAAARAKPGELNYGSPGIGTAGHLSAEILKSVGKIDIVHVPYGGSAPALKDLVAGRLSIMFDYTTSSLPHIQSGSVRALAVTGTQRLGMAPEIPTAVEQGYKDFDYTTWYALFAPAGTPPEVVEAINSALVKVSRSPDLQGRLQGLGLRSETGSPDELRRFVSAEMARWAKVISDANIKTE
jgi:tripartite-type tricarboxylate transporter receptor subunit TctC